MIEFSALSLGAFNRLDRARWGRLVAEDPEYRRVARWTTFPVRIEADTDHVDIVAGPDGLSFDAGASDGHADPIILSGSAEAWDAFLQLRPLPPNHSILGMERRRDDFRIIGDRHQLLRNLRPLVIILDLMRLAIER